MSTVAEVIEKFRRRYPSCESARGLQLFNEVHREFCSRSQVRNRAVAIDLTAGQGEYDLPSDVTLIQEAYHERSADPVDWTSLVERSLDEYAVRRRGWRSATTQAEPAEYYVTSSEDGDSTKARIGVWPVPRETATDGYPRLRLYATSVVDLDEDDSVPPQILNDNLYVYGMWAKWEAERQDGNLSDLQAYQALAEREMDRNVQHVKNVQENSTTQLVPAFSLESRRVI